MSETAQPLHYKNSPNRKTRLIRTGLAIAGIAFMAFPGRGVVKDVTGEVYDARIERKARIDAVCPAGTKLAFNASDLGKRLVTETIDNDDGALDKQVASMRFTCLDRIGYSYAVSDMRLADDRLGAAATFEGTTYDAGVVRSGIILSYAFSDDLISSKPELAINNEYDRVELWGASRVQDVSASIVPAVHN
jgi:hypothetical protein